MSAAAASQALNVDAELAAGNSSREEGDYATALQHFENAVRLAPTTVAAHFALASLRDEMCDHTSAYGDDPDCEAAFQGYQTVLKFTPTHREALLGVGYLWWQFDQLDVSERNYRNVLALDSNDAEALCAVAAIDLRRTYRDILDTRVRSDLPLGKHLFSSAVCDRLRTSNQDRVEEGIAFLKRAMTSNPDNPDLSSFLSSLYATRAELQCGNPKAYKRFTKVAWSFREKTDAIISTGIARESFQKCPPAPPPLVR